MKKILLMLLSVIAFAACSKKDDNQDFKHPKELQGTWMYEKSILPDGKLFSEITSIEEMECSKKTKYTFYGEFLTSEEHIFKAGNCQQNTASVKYFVENNKLCLDNGNGVVLKAYDIISLTSLNTIVNLKHFCTLKYLMTQLLKKKVILLMIF